jgi:hypothetical protein
MNQAQKDRGGTLVADNQPPEVLKPGVGPLHDPAPHISPHWSSIPRGRFPAVAAMRRDQFNPPIRQPLPPRVAVLGLVGNHAFRAGTGTTSTETSDFDGFKRDFREFDLRRGRRVQVNSERSTPAINQ